MNTALRIAELEQTNAQLTAQMATLAQQFGTEVAALRRQLDWFQRQLFGAKSEKQLAIDPAVQGNLLGALGVLAPPTEAPPLPEQAIAYTRRAKVRDAAKWSGYIDDALGREWQMATIQADLMMVPERFDLHYIDENGEPQRPICIHRAILGSLERFIGILVEHFAGVDPLGVVVEQVLDLAGAVDHGGQPRAARARA